MCPTLHVSVDYFDFDERRHNSAKAKILIQPTDKITNPEK